MSDMKKWKQLVESASKTLVENPVEDTDYTDHEVSMAKSQLLSAVKSATRIAKHLKDLSESEGLEGWVASKITMAEDYLQAVADYMDGEDLQEGYKILPQIDKDKYPEINGLEGPFRTLNGAVVYYDPKEGKYYDKDRDMYISYEEFRQMDTDYSGMKDERDIPVKEAKLSSEQQDRLNDLMGYLRMVTDPEYWPDDDSGDLGPVEILNIIRSEFGDKIADQVKSGSDNVWHWGRQHHTSGNDKLDWRKDKTTRITKSGKANKTDINALKNRMKRDKGSFAKNPSRLPESDLKEAKGLASIDWPDVDKDGDSAMAQHAENAIRHGMHAYDAYSHVYSMTLERDWMQQHKDELIKMFASYGLDTE
jgi:hypothetical protein